MDNFPTKRDYWYGFAIAIIGAIFLIISFVSNPSKLNSELGLASTITSIILSAIAIIYSLVDSSNNKKNSQKIIDASDVIENVTSNIDSSTVKLGELTKDLVNLELDKKLNIFQHMLEEVAGTITSMNDTVVTDISEIKSTISKTIPESGATTNITLKDSISNETRKKVGVDIINRLGESYYHPKEILYLVYKLKERDIQLFPHLSTYAKSIIASKGSDSGDVESGKAYCLVGFFSFLKCINWNSETRKVTFFAEELKEFTEKFEKENKEKAELINNFIENI